MEGTATEYGVLGTLAIAVVTAAIAYINKRSDRKIKKEDELVIHLKEQIEKLEKEVDEKDDQIEKLEQVIFKRRGRKVPKKEKPS